MSKLSPKEVEERIAAIARVLNKPDMAREREDELRVDFIRHVANSESVPTGIQRKARAILEVSKWNIPR